jgi:hypothetical protein
MILAMCRCGVGSVDEVGKEEERREEERDAGQKCRRSIKSFFACKGTVLQNES